MALEQADLDAVKQMITEALASKGDGAGDGKRAMTSKMMMLQKSKPTQKPKRQPKKV